MASRFWVGGTNTWNASAGTKWATTSGGAGGASAPTSADVAFFDANSGTGVVTIAAGAACVRFDCTGFTGTWAGSTTLSGLNGDCTLAAGMTYSHTGGLSFTPSVSLTLTTAGKTLSSLTVDVSGVAKNFVLTGDLTVSGAITLLNGAAAFDTTNSPNITCGSWAQSGTGTFTLAASRTLTITGAGGFTNSSSGSSSASASSTIKLQGGTVTFAGGGKTYGNFWIDSTASGTLTVSGANTFSDFKIEAPASGSRTVQFPASATTTVTSLTVSGFTPYNRLVLTSSTGAAADVLSDTAGTNTVDSCDISWCTASGGATWAATNSIDSGNNSGWTFSSTVDGLFISANF